MGIHMGIQWGFKLKKQNVPDGDSMGIQIAYFFELSFYL